MRSFDELAEKARDPKALTFARKGAIDELARHTDARVIGVLEELLDDGEAAIRREAINALGTVRSAGATRLLVRALDDGDRSCVKAALTQLGIRNDPAAAPALERLAEAGDFAVRIEAKRILTQLQVKPAEAKAFELRQRRGRRPRPPGLERRLEPPPSKEPAPAVSDEPVGPPVQPPVVPTGAPEAKKPPPVPLPPPPEVPIAPPGAETQPAPEASMPPLRELKRGFSRARGDPSGRPWGRQEPYKRWKTDQEQVRARVIGIAVVLIFIFFVLIGTCVSR